jgi:hypothetical protein
MDDDDHSYSDPELDELPANTLLEYEAAAIHATQPQRQSPPAAESNYGDGDDDDDEVVNLDAAAGPPRFARNAHDSGYHPTYDTKAIGHAHNDYGEPMDVEEPQHDSPVLQSQVDTQGLLERLKRVRTQSPRAPSC